MSDVPKFSPARLRAAREAAGISKRKLPQVSGVGHSTLKRIERLDYTGSVQLDVAIRLAHALDCTIEDFLEVPGGGV